MYATTTGCCNEHTMKYDSHDSLSESASTWAKCIGTSTKERRARKSLAPHKWKHWTTVVQYDVGGMWIHSTTLQDMTEILQPLVNIGGHDHLHTADSQPPRRSGPGGCNQRQTQKKQRKCSTNLFDIATASTGRTRATLEAGTLIYSAADGGRRPWRDENHEVFLRSYAWTTTKGSRTTQQSATRRLCTKKRCLRTHRCTIHDTTTTYDG